MGARVPLSAALCFLLVWGWTTSAHAALVAPVPEGTNTIVSPVDAPPLTEAHRVLARLTLDTDGSVMRVELVGDDTTSVYAQAVLLGATHFRFTPALDDGVPVAAAIVFTQEFLPAAPVVPAQEVATLRGVVIERGTRHPMPGVRIAVQTSLGPVTAQTDALGNFTMAVNPGTWEVYATAAGYKRFVVHESLFANEALEVRYLVERNQYDTYETLVVGKRDTTDVSRTTLSGKEIYNVPGTFGDPFRVITAMPGVSTMFSLFGYPIVRGTSPGSTGFLLDSVPMPELFHLLAGPSVIHPEFIDRIDFYPGTFPLKYGGYVGGIVDGVTRRARPEETRVDIDVDFLQAGGFLRGPLPGGMTGTVAGRYGYPGALLAAFSSPLGLEYWDYQARLDGTFGGGQFKVFAFGASDNLTTTSEGLTTVAFATQFHRLDLGYHHTVGKVTGDYTVYLGIDSTSAGGVIENLNSLVVAPLLRWKWHFSDVAQLHWGLDGSANRYTGFISLLDSTLSSHLYDTGGYVEMPLALTEAMQLTVGARSNFYQNDTTSKLGIDPRFSWRWHVADTDAGEVYLKAGAGRFHQPPRLLIPVPGLQAISLSRGLEAAWQSMIGAEVPIVQGIDVDVQLYYNYTDPIIFDLAANSDPDTANDPNASTSPTNSTLFNSVLTPQIGRSYGLEVILRHRDLGGAFGWLSYTLSRTERRHDGGWVPFDYDRTHMLQAVGGVTLPRNWQIGMRLGLETGRPVSTSSTYNVARSPGYARFDIRIDKRAVYNQWLLDFYIDIINVTLTPEFIDQASISPRYLLPTIGLRAVL